MDGEGGLERMGSGKAHVSSMREGGNESVLRLDAGMMFREEDAGLVFGGAARAVKKLRFRGRRRKG